MNSSFFNTTSILFFVFIIFIILCFSTMLHSLSCLNGVSFSSSAIIIPDKTNVSFFASSSFLWPTPRV